MEVEFKERQNEINGYVRFDYLFLSKNNKEWQSQSFKKTYIN